MLAERTSHFVRALNVGRKDISFCAGSQCWQKGHLILCGLSMLAERTSHFVRALNVGRKDISFCAALNVGSKDISFCAGSQCWQKGHLSG